MQPVAEPRGHGVRAGAAADPYARAAIEPVVESVSRHGGAHNRRPIGSAAVLTTRRVGITKEVEAERPAGYPYQITVPDTNSPLDRTLESDRTRR